MSRDDVYAMTGIDPWFLKNIEELIEMESEIESVAGELA
jgi:hypothetical protein